LTMAVSPFVLVTLCLSLVESKFYRPFQFSRYDSGLGPQRDQGSPTSRHKNHCAYVVEKTASFTVQDGAAPYVKAEYNKCSWGQKCPTLQYRLLYKPLFRVAHKTVTELEWRCCPGYSGYGCLEGRPFYQHAVKTMPPFKGPPMKGPTFKGPRMNTMVKANAPSPVKGPPASGFHYPMRHFGAPGSSSSYPDNSFEHYPTEPEVMPEHEAPHRAEHEQEHEHGEEPALHLQEEIPPPSSGGEQPEEETRGQTLDSETKERLYRMEEGVRHLNQGLETLRATVNGLEESLRASLREDANRMLSALLSAAPGPVPAPAGASRPSAVGFAEIPGGDPETEGLDGRRVSPGLAELNGRIGELRTELQAKTAELRELKATVTGHDGTLKQMSMSTTESTGGLRGNAQADVEALMEARLSAARTEILAGFESRLESAEVRCEEKAGDVRRQCRKEHGERQEQMEDTLEDRTTKVAAELRNVQAQIHGVKAAESCCGTLSGLVERVQLLEASMVGLNQSQGRVIDQLGAHKDHIEGVLEGRLGYIEDTLNLTQQIESNESGKRSFNPNNVATAPSLEGRMEGRMAALEGRLLTALEELSNTTGPTLLEGHAIPNLETELESLRVRLEVDVDRLQTHLSSLEILCSSSCSPPRNGSGIQGDSAEESVKVALDVQEDRLNGLNVTLQQIQKRLREREEQAKSDPPVRGELTTLKFNVRSVSHALKGLTDSLGSVVHQVGRANTSWHEREVRLAQQIKGVVQLVGHQASMLAAGERRLTRLKGELQEMRRRLAQAVQGCRTTAMGVQKEVTEVGGRVASVEDQCKGLNELADDLEKIRQELEGQSNGQRFQVNGTLSSHELQNRTAKVAPTERSSDREAGPRGGGAFTLD
ncbi:LOW QUALITY PROTEIN: EMILIN-3-like, partial [Brachionichthys hirsutus]|uniref:LOW QUALITY PROTEIN: EMILIN-3-like n=1 Tax=Brachionichthys hirsutus TaxID=412623 RepID=UPI0036051D2D